MPKSLGSRNTLFFPYCGKDSRLMGSPPSRGARIETYDSTWCCSYACVAPFTGGAD